MKFTTASLDGIVYDAFEDEYGRGVEFVFAWSAFYIQKLWLLSAYAIFWLAIDASSFKDDPDRRWIWEVMKMVVVLWAGWVYFFSRRKFERFRETRSNQVEPGSLNEDLPSGSPEEPALTQAPKKTLVLRDGREVITLVARNTQETSGQKFKRLASLWFIAIPCILLVIAACVAVLSGVTMLVLHVIYIWGDCLERHKPDKVCRDAEQKFAFIGWAAEVGCDILCAIIFEILFPIGSALAKWVARLQNHEYEPEERFVSGMLELLLAAIERVGFVGSLAFLFAPQWEEPQFTGQHGDIIDRHRSCDDLFLGDSSYFCYSRRLPVEVRRWVFESLLKGPFIVAPFVGILVKVIIPRAVRCISGSLDRTLAYKCCIFLAPLRCLFRLIGVIFSYDGGAVSCLKYAFKGPHIFSDIPESHSDRATLTMALEQVKRKPFEVNDEITELEMSFLWVTFFAPIMPFGVIVTTIAKYCELRTDLAKMLWVRRHPVPESDRIARREMNTYAACVALGSLGWTAGLSMMTYNDDLWKWGSSGRLLLLAVVLWLLLIAVAVTKVTNRKVKASSHAVA